jgi:type II secretory pathway component PulF
VQRSELRSQLALAGRLGTLEGELSHQIYARLSELPIRASAQRELIGFVVNLLLGIIIGALIVAIYIPIFRLAVVI